MLRQRAARCDGSRLACFVWRVLWHNWRAGLCVGRRRRHLGADCSRSSCGTFSGGPNIAMIRVVMPAHLRTLAGVSGEGTLEVGGEGTRGAILNARERQYPRLQRTRRRTLLCPRRSRREQNRFTSLAPSRAVDGLNCFSGVLQTFGLGGFKHPTFRAVLSCSSI